MSEATVTTDHEAIKAWAEARDGYPARVKETKDWDDVGILRIGFQDSEDNLEKLTWGQFFEAFENNGLALLHQDKLADGSQSRFCKFVPRES